MERTILFLTLFSATMFGASPFCAFGVRVRDPSGRPLSNIAVVMVDHEAHLPGTTDANGLVRFCDAPLRPVDFVIGYRECGVVFVKGVVFTWPESRDIYVVYNNAHCRDELIPPTTCQFLGRIRNEKGEPISGVLLHGGQSQTDVSDAFGRIFQTIKSGGRLDGVLEKEGWERVHVSQRCIRGDERDVEQSVTLHRLRNGN
jgi:hypothetical protein